ncbi:MAG: phage Gp37/Gp68 family protein [Actinobacteria bacterium]|nr:phage Gp37/Gp68 family protein [Actinomycetota bacterium]
MSDGSKIEWTDATWNPVTGCDRVSPGCDNCYALTGARRWKAMGNPRYQLDGDPRTSGPGFGVALHADKLDQPLRWSKPRRIFVNSTSDLFHPRIPEEFIARVFATMAAAPQHTFQVLTKRPKRMHALLGGDYAAGLQTLLEVAHDEREAQALYDADWPLPNVWLGVSVEDAQRADERIPALIDTPAAVRFLSCEPLLGRLDLRDYLHGPGICERCGGSGSVPVLGGGAMCPACEYDNARWMGPSPIQWVIVGGESGPGARPMDVAWARTIVGQCQAAGVPVFVKQLGSRPFHHVVAGVTDWPISRHSKGGDPEEWPTDLRVREWPEAVSA